MSYWATTRVKQEQQTPLHYREAVRYIPEDEEWFDVAELNEWHGNQELATVYA